MNRQTETPTQRSLQANRQLRLQDAPVLRSRSITSPQIASSNRASMQNLPARMTSTVPTHRLARNTNIQSIVESRLRRSPTNTATERDHGGQSLTTFRNLREAEVSGGVFVNTPGPVSFYHEGISSRQPPDNDGAAGTNVNNHPTHNYSSKMATPGSSEHSEYEIYCKYLMVKQRGSPLWEPGPRIMFSTEYRRNGVSIGDVGILNPTTGYFAFLFNIFLPADHEINEGRVPNGFVPLDKSKAQKSITKSILYDRGSCLASSSLRRTDSSDFSFQSTGREGALLVMPDGALTVDLENYKLVEKYIATNAKSWWEYVESDDCGVQNENVIQVVVGTDKVSSWAMATFENVNTEEPIQFELRDDGTASQAPTYKWKKINSGRTGPSEEEIRDLWPLPNTPLRNQCVFVRTLNVSASSKVRDELAVHEVCSSCLRNCMCDSSSSGQRHPNIQTSKGGPSFSHPSKLLNAYLLEKCASTEVVITRDSDWMSVITEDDTSMPSVEDICARVLDSHAICEEKGVVTLKERKDTYEIGSFFLETKDRAMAGPSGTLDNNKWSKNEIEDSENDVGRVDTGPEASPSPKSPPRLGMAHVANLFVASRKAKNRIHSRRGQDKLAQTILTSGEPQTHPGVENCVQPDQPRIPVEFAESYICSGGVNVVPLLTATRAALLDRVESTLGADTLTDEQWECIITGSKPGIYKVQVRYMACATKSTARSPRRPVCIERARGIPGLMTIVKRCEN